MNAERRQKLDAIHSQLLEAISQLEDVMAEEEEARDNMPESLQGGERYNASEEASYAMEEARDEIESAADKILELVEG